MADGESLCHPHHLLHHFYRLRCLIGKEMLVQILSIFFYFCSQPINDFYEFKWSLDNRNNKNNNDNNVGNYNNNSESEVVKADEDL